MLAMRQSFSFFKRQFSSYARHYDTQLSQLVAEKTATQVKQLIDTPFTWAIINNDLSKEVLANFIEQEEYFLQEYDRAKTIIAEKLPPDLAKQFQSANRCTSQNERKLLDSFKVQFKLGSPTGHIAPITQAYSEYLIYTAKHEPVACAVAATLPCYSTYLQLGEFIAQHISLQHPYAVWSKNYVSHDFRQSTEKQTRLFDLLGDKAPEKIRNRMMLHYEKSIQFELDFRTALMSPEKDHSPHVKI